MTNQLNPRFGFWRGVFFLLLGVGLVLTVMRFTQGLGSVTNLSDRYPWGLWVGFDLLCGVGLAAGGFVLTATVYIFNIQRFKPIVRPAVLTAFLGYIMVVTALLFDLGRPWNIWHPLVMGNPTSVMFEVALCVMSYTAVLGLEFSGMVFERVGWKRAWKVQKAVTVPLVIFGVVLSTFHQSSLGTLYLIVPGKLHALWYTPVLPIVFFVSSAMVGLAMVIVESHISARAFGRQLEMPLLSDLGRVLAAVLGVYLVLRVFDLFYRGAAGQAFGFTYEAMLFQLEFAVGLLLPLVLLLIPKVRANTHGLYGSALLVVLGFIVHRLNVSITGFEGAQGGRYIPSLGEALITLMMIAIGFAAFRFCVRTFNVYPEEAHEPVIPAYSRVTAEVPAAVIGRAQR
jgi:Ni/Fe-hydrogenase subunit HybB-like protein